MLIIKRFKSIVLIFILIPSSLFPQKEIEKNINKGLEYSYNFKWEKAGEVFRNIIKKYEDDPRGYHYLSGIYLWYYLSTKDEEDMLAFISYSDSVIEKAEAKLEINPTDENWLYTIGSTYTFRAIAFAKSEVYLDAAWASKKSESYLNEALEIKPDLYDVYLGLGLYNFAIGQIPAAFKWALNLAGIDGDKETGIKYIKLAADKGNHSKVEAQYYFSQIVAEFFNDVETSSLYLKNLVKKYPANLLFNYSLASIYIKDRKLREAEKILRKISSVDNSKFIQIISFSNFLLADIFFKKNEFDSAKIYYHKFLETTTDNDYTGIVNYRLAVSYEITGDRLTAEKYFEQTNSGNMDLDDDIFARRKGNIYSKRTMSENEIELVKGANLIDSGNYKTAYDTLTSLLVKIQSEKLRAETYLYLSETTFCLGKLGESLSLAAAALKTDISDEKWIAPFACYYAARANKELGDSTAVSYFIDKAEDYSDYDYENRLKNLIYSINVKEVF